MSFVLHYFDTKCSVLLLRGFIALLQFGAYQTWRPGQ